MIQQYVHPAGWLLPVFGVGVGLLTNWLALKMTFSPVEPIRLFGGRCVLQGCFLKRQREVAPQYAENFVKHIGNAKKLVTSIAVGGMSENLGTLIRQEMGAAIDRCSS